MAFLVAVCFITLNDSDTVTRAVIGVVLVGMSTAVGVVLHADWGSIAPSPDSLWRRTQHALWAMLEAIGQAIVKFIPRFKKGAVLAGGEPF